MSETIPAIIDSGALRLDGSKAATSLYIYVDNGSTTELVKIEQDGVA